VLRIRSDCRCIPAAAGVRVVCSRPTADHPYMCEGLLQILDTPILDNKLTFCNEAPLAMKLNSDSLLKLIRVAYESENPRKTLHEFLLFQDVSPDLGAAMMHQMVNLPADNHPMAILRDEPDLVSDAKESFILLATSLSHVQGVSVEGRIYLWERPRSYSFYKSPNVKLPFVWLRPNEFGMPQLIGHYAMNRFRVHLTRIEELGAMLPLRVDYLGGGCDCVAFHITVTGRDSIELTGVNQRDMAVEFFLLLTLGVKHEFVLLALVQPRRGDFISYPMCLHPVE
jgi:hypothetical protein